MIDFGELDLYADCTEDFPFTATLYERDGITQTGLAAGDVVWCVLSERDGSTTEPENATLRISSDDPTDNDSLVTLDELGDTDEDASGSVRFAQADTAAIAAAWADGVTSQRYVCELFYVDASESAPSDAKKIFLRGIIHLHRTASLS